MSRALVYLLLGWLLRLAENGAFSLPSAPSPAGVCEDKTKYLNQEINLCCTMCKPGMRLKTMCSNSSDTVCEACRPGSYNDQMNYYPKCFRCPLCKDDQGLQYVQKCNGSSSSICACKRGMFCTLRDHSKQCKACTPFTICTPGYGVSQKGTEDSDVKCSPCPKGTFSDKYSYTDTCQHHTDCSSQGRDVLLPGNNVSDTQCGPVVRPPSTFDPSTTSTTTHTVSTGNTVSSTPSTTGFLIPKVYVPPSQEDKDVKWIIGGGVSVVGGVFVLLFALVIWSRKRALGSGDEKSSACQKKAMDLQDGRSTSISCRFLGCSRPGASAPGPELSPCQEDSLWGLLLPKEKATKERCITVSEKGENVAH